MDRAQKADLVADLNRTFAEVNVVVVTRNLGRDEDWLADLALSMEPEDGLIWVYDPMFEDGTMAFTEFGVENLLDLIDIHRNRTE